MGICKDKAEFVKTLVDSYFKGCAEPLTYGAAVYRSFDQIPKEQWDGIFNYGSVIYELYRWTKNLPNIETDLENFDAGWISDDIGDGVIGMTSRGEYYLKFHGGGDGELPFDAILYVEDGEIKVYVPEDGNCIDTKYHCAWGQEWMMDDFDENGKWARKVSRMLEDEDYDGFDSVKECNDIERFFSGEEKPSKEQEPPVGDDDEYDEPEDEEDEDESEEDEDESEEDEDEDESEEDEDEDESEEDDGYPTTREIEEAIIRQSQKNDSIDSGKGIDPSLFWLVDVSKFCLRRGRNGNPSTVSAQGKSSYPNLFQTRGEALEYAHLMMMLNHGAQVHDWERFSKVVKVFEAGENADADFGYVHEGIPSIEWFTWFDKRGQYPCVIDIVTIREVKAQAHDDGGNPVPLQAVQVQHYFNPEGVDEFTMEEHERHQEIADAMADEIGGLETMCADDKNAEYEKMRKMLGWDDEG